MVEKVLSKQDIEDFLTGAEILGTGGGGGIEWARGMLKFIDQHDKKIRLIDPKDVPKDALVVGAAGVGGGVTKDIREKIEKKFGARPSMESFMKTSILAEKMMSGELGDEIYAFLAFELGCGNTILPGCIAAMNDKYLVDGDCNGRAVPEIELCTLNIKDIPFTPIAIVTPWMETMIVKKVYDYSRAEDICRYVAVVSGGSCMTMGAPVRGRMLPEVIVNNSVSGSINLGKAVREARERGRDPVEAAVKSVDGYLLFKGVVTRFEREERGGFMWGEHHYKGVDEYEGHKFKVWYKNENQISWIDEKPYVTCPDSLCVLDAETGKGLSNWGADYSQGRKVAVIGIKAADLWLTPRGLEIFNPKHFGFDIEYHPIEKFVGSKH
ncbi:DUF917 domain-containing protein [Candidatus Bathyarchaeota archaeon]|nr:DUF917 domain-containing protein [Candidatus Bathyarchaeota archaeon]